MDIDSPFKCSQGPESPRNLSQPDRYLEVASSSKPYPVARLLDQVSALQGELRQERQWHENERAELERQHQADRKQIRHENEAKLSQQRRRHQEILNSLKEKAAAMEGDWSDLEAKMKSLRLEVGALEVIISVLQGTATSAITVDWSTQTIIQDSASFRLPVRSPVRPNNWQVKELNVTSSKMYESIDASVNTGPDPWAEEKSSLLNRQKVLETTIAALQKEAKSLNEFIAQLQERLQAQRPLIKERHFELADLQMRNATSSNLYKEWADGFKDLNTQLQRQSELVQKAGDAFHSSLAPGTQLQTSWADEVEAELETAQTGTITAGSKSIALVQESNKPSSLSFAPSITWNSTGKTGQKRTLTALHTEDHDTSSTNAQRRRTSHQTYVTIPSRSDKFKQGLNPKAADFRPSRDCSTDWLTQPSPSQSSWQDRFNNLLRGKENQQASDTSDSDFSTTKRPLDQSPVLSQPTVSLPPNAEKMAGQKRKRIPERQGEAAFVAPGLFHESTLPFKAPTPRPKKWKQSVLKKG